jgi:signal transduction histidine kinase/CheY-like chemotaxis protein
MRWRFNVTAKMVGYLLVASLVPLVLLGISAFEISKRIVLEQAEAENARLVGSFASYFKLYGDQVNDMAANIAGNEAIGAALRRTEEDKVTAFDRLEMGATMGRLLNSYVRVKGLVSIDVFSVKGEHFHVGESLNSSRVDPARTAALFSEAVGSRAPTLWRGVDDNLDASSRQKKVLSVVRAIQHFSAGSGQSDTVGVLVIELNDEIMRTFLQGVSLVAGSQLMEVDRNGVISLHSDSGKFGQAVTADLLKLIRNAAPSSELVLDGQDVLMNVAPADEQQSVRLVITPRRTLTQKVNNLALATLALIGLGLLVILVLTWNFVRTVVRPIRAVSQRFQLLASHPDVVYETLPNDGSKDEIGLLISGYNDYLAALLEQRAVARNLARSEEERQATEIMLTTSIDAIDEAFSVFDENDCLVFCNDKFRAIYPEVTDLVVPGVSFKELLRSAVRRRRAAGNADIGEAWVARQLALHRSIDAQSNEQLDDGRWIRIVKRKTAQGQTVGFRVDITALMHAQQDAVAASDAKSAFLANMSHEIRTPMNAILGMLKLLHSTELTARQLDYASKSEGAAKSLLSLINDILDFSKIEAGKLELDIEAFRLDKLLRDLSVILSVSVGAKSVEVLFDIDLTTPPVLKGDALRLQQILINLCSNAIKFTAQGEVVIQIGVQELKADTALLRFSVKDSGIGIAPDKQEYIFSGFSQAETSTTRRFGGTGLGLSICKRLVVLMGGELRLQSELGKGSTFHFTIPLGIGDARTGEPGTMPHRIKEPLTVLVVDDNHVALELISGMARSWGWEVDSASDGAHAVALVTERGAAGRPPYQAIFMDWEMPGMDGWETIANIRQAQSGGSAPIAVMITAHSRESLTQRSAREQAQLSAFLVKPVTASMLFDAVADARAGHSQLRGPTRTREKGRRRLKGMRLLVVEDNAINLQIARELLAGEGAEVETAANGMLGVAALAQAAVPFDAVLMDLQMPVMDGYAATRLIRDQLGLTNLPVIAMTANAMAADRQACLDAGMNDHVGKPFELNHLVSVLLQLTGLQPAEPDLNAPEIVNLSASVAAARPLSNANWQDSVGLHIDTKDALERMLDMKPLYVQMIGEFLRELPTVVPQYRGLLDASLMTDAVRHMHTLKGTAATLGATDLSALAAELEEQCKGPVRQAVENPRSEELQSMIDATREAMELVVQQLQEPAPA